MSMQEYLVGVVLLIAVLAAVGAATALVVRRRLSHLDALERLLASATIASGILIAVHLVPLMLGLLARGSVLAAAALAALVRPSTPIAADGASSCRRAAGRNGRWPRRARAAPPARARRPRALGRRRDLRRRLADVPPPERRSLDPIRHALAARPVLP